MLKRQIFSLSGLFLVAFALQCQASSGEIVQVQASNVHKYVQLKDQIEVVLCNGQTVEGRVGVVGRRGLGVVGRSSSGELKSWFYRYEELQRLSLRGFRGGTRKWLPIVAGVGALLAVVIPSLDGVRESVAFSAAGAAAAGGLALGWRLDRKELVIEVVQQRGTCSATRRGQVKPGQTVARLSGFASSTNPSAKPLQAAQPQR